MGALTELVHTSLEKRYVTIILVALMLGGLVFRVLDLGKQSLWIDEAYTVNGASAVLVHGYPKLESGEFYSNNILTVYITALTMESGLFDPFSPWVARLPNAIFGTLLIGVMFLLTWSIFRKTGISLLSAFLTAFSYWEIAWSRQIRGYAACAFFTVIALIFLWQFIQSRTWKWFIWASILILVGSLFHFVALALLPVFIVTAIVSLYEQKPFEFLSKKLLRGLVLMFLLESLAFVIFFSSSLGNIFHLFDSMDILLILGTLVCMAAGLMDKQFQKQSAFLSLTLGILIVSILLFSPVTHLRYVFILIPVAVLLISRGAFSIGTYLSQSLLYSRIATVLVLLVFCSTTIQWYPFTTYALEKDSPQPDFAAAYARIKELKKDTDVIVSSRPVLHQIYLREKGLWLAVSTVNLNLFKSENPDSNEYYVGAPAINDALELEDTLTHQHGFIVMDGLTRQRLWGKVDLIENNPNIKLVYTSGILDEDMIWVYRF